MTIEQRDRRRITTARGRCRSARAIDPLTNTHPIRALTLGALTLGAVACNAVLGIDDADLSCAPGACDEAFGVAGPPAFGGVTAPPGSTLAPMMAGVDAGASAATPPTAATPAAPSGAPPSAVSGEGAPQPASPPTAPPIAAGDAGASADPAEAPSPDPVLAEPVGPPLDANGFAVALPNDLINAPVSGEIIFSEEAQWEVDGVFRPTFEIHTPTASYWIVKSLGTMVSMQDAYAGQLQWIDFSSGFRPLRNIPAFATPPAQVNTVLDRDSQTPTHLRLTADSADGAWHWVWDFYITHATLTLDRAPSPVGFAYRGVPAGLLGMEDQLIQSDGTAQGARNSFTGDVPGPAEWVYIADGAANRSLFLMQHTDDDLPETYQVRDNDSAHFSFGGGQISALPMRFSLGLVNGVDLAVVRERANFVSGAIH